MYNSGGTRPALWCSVNLATLVTTGFCAVVLIGVVIIVLELNEP